MGGAITFNLSMAANLSALRARRFLTTARSRVASRRVAKVVAFFRRIRFAELYGLGIVLSNLLVDIEARTVTALAPEIRGRWLHGMAVMVAAIMGDTDTNVR
jgi:hypothetical protein